MAAIRLISERWLNNKKAELPSVAKTTSDGSPNPNYAAMEAEITEAEKHLAARREVERIAKQHDFRPNSYEGKCAKSGAVVKPGCGFTRKENGKWTTYSFPVVQELVGFNFEG